MHSRAIACRRALSRAGLYRLLALGFGYPEPERSGEFRRLLARLREAEAPAHDLSQELAGLDGIPSSDPAAADPSPSPWIRLEDRSSGGGEGPREHTTSAGMAELAGEYLRLFDRTVACSPYESEHSQGVKSFTKSRDLADIQGFYAAFGLELGPAAAEMGDHIQVELEFMAALALKEAYLAAQANDEGLEITSDAQRSFLRDHLGRWAPAFCDRLADAATHPFYVALAAATRSMIAHELTELGVVPMPQRPSSPGAPAIAPDDLAGEQFVCPKAEVPASENPLVELPVV